MTAKRDAGQGERRAHQHECLIEYEEHMYCRCECGSTRLNDSNGSWVVLDDAQAPTGKE